MSSGAVKNFHGTCSSAKNSGVKEIMLDPGPFHMFTFYRAGGVVVIVAVRWLVVSALFMWVTAAGAEMAGNGASSNGAPSVDVASAGYAATNGNGASASNGSNGYAAGYGLVIEIWKTARKMQLREAGTLLGEYRVSLGSNPSNTKQVQGDGRTPVGRYYISDKNPGSRFHRFLGISYPNVDDAERGYKTGLLDAGQWADVYLANLRGDRPPSHTALGGRVGIHGFGGRPYVPVDWTEGCIAVSDNEIEYIFQRAPVGTLVIINE
jgi:hypothetical protein